jgi:O-antigen/teichoic acid export membrane protein
MNLSGFGRSRHEQPPRSGDVLINWNLIANYLNVGWVALMGFAFVPLYVKYLGVESYGLIGLFVVLQVWLNLLDVGLSPTLGREMARFLGGEHGPQSIRRLLRTIEIIAVGFMLLIMAGVGMGSGWLAENWVRSTSLSAETINHAMRWMAIIGGLGFLEGIYRSAMIGLQRQVILSALTSGVATLKGLGAIALIVFVSPRIELFFAWQAACSIVMLLSLRTLVYATLPPSSEIVGFDLSALQSIRSFASGVFMTTLLATMLTQSDKFILTGMLTLAEWGHYSLAVLSAGALGLLYQPIYQVWLPRMSELVASSRQQELTAFFHLGSQLVAVVIGSAAAVAITQATTLLHVWTGDRQLVATFDTIFRLLVLGNMLNALLAIPYALQLANGWTSLGVRANAIAVLVLVPVLLLTVPVYRGIGAASLWVGLNLGYLLIGMHFMFARLMVQERCIWFRADLLQPLAASFGTATLLAWLLPQPSGRVSGFLAVLGIGLAALAASVLVAPRVKAHLINAIKRQP